METQLVRLDKPYNIICNPDGKFGLHIATLIVINEKAVKDAETGNVVDTYPVVKSYPVVGGGYGIDGNVWMQSELKDCFVICREGESVDLFKLKRFMEFYKTDRIEEELVIPGKFSVALATYGSKLELPIDDNNHIINDYEVQLEFSEGNNGRSCMVYAVANSEFHFYDYFDNEPPFTQAVHTNSESIEFLTNLRDSYVIAFHYEGLHSITFTTKDEKYQWFVDKLNGTKADAARV